MTHAALSRVPCGISSGILRISVITLPAFLTRSFSFFWADAGRPSSAITTSNEKIFFIICSFPILSRVQGAQHLEIEKPVQGSPLGAFAGLILEGLPPI